MIASSGYFRDSGDEWLYIDHGKECLVCGVQYASPFFLGGTEHCCGGRTGRANMRVPAQSRELTPSWWETVYADASLLPVHVGVSTGMGSQDERSRAVRQHSEIACVPFKLQQGHLR